MEFVDFTHLFEEGMADESGGRRSEGKQQERRVKGLKTPRLSNRVEKVPPLLRVPLQAQLHKGVEVRRERPVVRVSLQRGRGLAVGVANAAGARTLADARVGP